MTIFESCMPYDTFYQHYKLNTLFKNKAYARYDMQKAIKHSM